MCVETEEAADFPLRNGFPMHTDIFLNHRKQNERTISKSIRFRVSCTQAGELKLTVIFFALVDIRLDLRKTYESQ